MSLDIDWSLLTSLYSNSSGPSVPTTPAPSTSSHANAATVSSLAASFVSVLNKHLAAATRPSFLGPVVVTEFDFGDIGPEVEIKDVGDIWQVFEDDESEEDEDEEILNGGGGAEDEWGDGDGHLEDWDDSSYAKYDRRRRRQSAAMASRPRRNGRGLVHDEHLGGEDWSYINRKATKAASTIGDRLARDRLEHRRFRDELSMDPSHVARRNGEEEEEHEHEHDHDDSASVSVLSGIMTPRTSLHFGGAAIGIGLGAGLGVNLAGSGSVGGGMIRGLREASIQSQPMMGRQRQRMGGDNLRNGNNMRPLPPQMARRQSHEIHDRDTRADHRQSHTPDVLSPSALSAPLLSEPSSPSAPSSSPLPSLQLLLHLSHSPNIHLTIRTSLQINYPSPSFMSLPLKISITGLSLNADIVIAFDGGKRRVHLCLIDELDQYTPSPALSRSHSTVLSTGASVPVTPEASKSAGFGGFRPLSTLDNHTTAPASRPVSIASSTGLPSEPPKPIGQRILPSLQIESEIGHADAHVLRNVGKVEKFITDVVRKTLVDELVFPNYHTIAL